VPKAKKYKLVLNSDEDRFGGWGNEVPAELTGVKEPCGLHPCSVKLDMHPYSAVIYEF